MVVLLKALSLSPRNPEEENTTHISELAIDESKQRYREAWASICYLRASYSDSALHHLGFATAHGSPNGHPHLKGKSCHWMQFSILPPKCEAAPPSGNF